VSAPFLVPPIRRTRKCPRCGLRYPRRAPSCPHCGGLSEAELEALRRRVAEEREAGSRLGWLMLLGAGALAALVAIAALL